MTQALSIDQKQSALKKIISSLKPVGKYGAQLTLYATALGALATIGGIDLTSTPFNILVSSVGFNLLSNIIERVAKGETIPDEVLQTQVEVAIQESELEKLLTKNDFYRAVAKIIRSQDKILSAAKVNDVDIRRLARDIEVLIKTLRADQSRNSPALPNIVEVESSYPSWKDLPDLSEFTGRNIELEELEKITLDKKRVIAYGISGTGKTLLAAKLAENLKSSDFKVCWIGINIYLEIDDIKNVISKFFFDNGMEALSDKINNSEPAILCQDIIDSLLSNKVYLFFDSLNSANPNAKKLIEDLLSASTKFDILGGIFISSTYLPNCYSRVEISNGKIVEFGVAGFSPAETISIFNGAATSFTQEELLDFHEAVGGHPMSISFLLQLIQNSSVVIDDVLELKKKGIEASRDWLFTRVFKTLENDEQELILALSIFDYDFDDRYVDLVYPSGVRPQFSLMPLVKKNLVHYVGEKFVLHEAIRSLCYEMIATAEGEKLHRRLADFLHKEMESSESFDFELGYKWSYHLENLSSFSSEEQTIRKLLTLDNAHLSALLAIVYYGYPFEFEDETLAVSKEICKSLSANKWIKKSILGLAKVASPIKVKRQYVPVGLEPLDVFFLDCLCRRRGIAGALGYFDIPRENFAFYMQGLICQWEHTIELQPLLIDREENEESEARSCPVFGHSCPGGKKQVAECKEIFN